MTYSLYIRRYRRNISHLTLEELRQELAQYFTKREIESGIVDRLTNFGSRKPPKDGFLTNSWQDFEVHAYSD